MKSTLLIAALAALSVLSDLRAQTPAPSTPAPATLVTPVTPPHIVAVPFTMTAAQFAQWLATAPAAQTLQSVFAAAAPVQAALASGQTLVAIKSVMVTDIDQATVNITVRAQVAP